MAMNLWKRMKQWATRLRVRYSKHDDGLYLFFRRDGKSQYETNTVYITSCINQVITSKVRRGGRYINQDTIWTTDGKTTVISFPKGEDTVLYIPKANRVTEITVANTSITNPLSDFGLMTSLEYLDVNCTDVYGKFSDLYKCIFLRFLNIKNTNISGYTSDGIKFLTNLIDVEYDEGKDL